LLEVDPSQIEIIIAVISVVDEGVLYQANQLSFKNIK
jgi:hypothetical protein